MKYLEYPSKKLGKLVCKVKLKFEKFIFFELDMCSNSKFSSSMELEFDEIWARSSTSIFSLWFITEWVKYTQHHIKWRYLSSSALHDAMTGGCCVLMTPLGKNGDLWWQIGFWNEFFAWEFPQSCATLAWDLILPSPSEIWYKQLCNFWVHVRLRPCKFSKK